MLWRARIIWQSVRSFGLRATWLALRAVAHGAVQKIGEFAALSRIVSELKPDVVLEIGTHAGGSYWAWCRLATPTATLVSIDFPGSDDVASQLRGYLRQEQSQRLIRADSHDPKTFEAVRDLGGAVDFLFIDGDHSYEGAKADFERWQAFVRPDGHVLFHDAVDTGGYGNVYPGVAQLVEEIERGDGWVRHPGAGSIAHFTRAS